MFSIFTPFRASFTRREIKIILNPIRSTLYKNMAARGIRWVPMNLHHTFNTILTLTMTRLKLNQ